MAFSNMDDAASPRQIGFNLAGSKGSGNFYGYKPNPELQFKYQRFCDRKYTPESLYNMCFDEVQAKSKERLTSMVRDEDDLGPEVIMNLKWLDTYRFPQRTVYMVQDLVQTLTERYDWARIISNPTEDALEQQHVGDLFDQLQAGSNFDQMQEYSNDPSEWIRFAPYLFYLLNRVLIQCKLSHERERTVANFAKFYMSQPLPHSLMPLETYRILQNEIYMPGLTKVLMIAQEFPMLDLAPEKFREIKSHDFTVLNQAQQVFVYEDLDEKGEQIANKSGKNGTLIVFQKLLSEQASVVKASDLHAIRKEFLQRVFTFYILRHGAGRDDGGSSIGRMNANQDGESDGPLLRGDMNDIQQTAMRVNDALNRMDPAIVFKLYSKVAKETREKLTAQQILPDVYPTDSKGRQNDGFQSHGHNQANMTKNEHPALKQIISKLVQFVYQNFIERQSTSPDKDYSGQYESQNLQDGRANIPKLLLSFPSKGFKPEVVNKMNEQRCQSVPSNFRSFQQMNTIEEEKEMPSATQPLSAAEPAPIFQAKNLEQFLKIAFEIQNLSEDRQQKLFQVGSNDPCESFGAKMLVVGNDATFNHFVQDYVNTAMTLNQTANEGLQRKVQVFLIPSGYNSLAHFIATREPLYRQNIFQFFSQLNPFYAELVKAGGTTADLKSLRNTNENEMKELYDRVLQTYLRDAKRPFQLKVFKAKVYYGDGDQAYETHYFTNRIEVGIQQQHERLQNLHSFFESFKSENSGSYYENLTNARDQGLMDSLESRNDTCKIDVQCCLVDQLGKQHDIGQPLANCSVARCSYVKLINVPSMVDISGTLPDPTDGSLCLSMIDHASLNHIARFVKSTRLAGELSHTGSGEIQVGLGAAVGNYYYDDGSQASDIEAEGSNRRILDNTASDAAASMGRAQTSSLSKRINQPNSAVNQLRKVLQAVHLNQRVVSTTIDIKPTIDLKPVLVSIDGIELNQEVSKKIRKIEVSRVFKYQEFKEREQKLLEIAEWVDSALETNERVRQLLEHGRSNIVQLNLHLAYQVAFHILSRQINLHELNFDDFKEWFVALREKKTNNSQRGEHTIEFKGKGRRQGNKQNVSDFTMLLYNCARQAIHLSVPVQTFTPVSL